MLSETPADRRAGRSPETALANADRWSGGVFGLHPEFFLARSQRKTERNVAPACSRRFFCSAPRDVCRAPFAMQRTRVSLRQCPRCFRPRSARHLHAGQATAPICFIASLREPHAFLTPPR